MSAEALGALFGRVYNDGTSVELSGGLNFKNGVRARLNTSTHVIDIDVDDNATVATYATMATLRDALEALEVESGDLVFTTGYSTAGDGGDGAWLFVDGAAPGTYTHNGGTVVVADGGDGSSAALRQYRGAIHASWFGFSTSGTAAANNTALQAAVDARTYGKIELPPGSFALAGLDIAGRKTVSGAGEEVTRLLVTAPITMTGVGSASYRSYQVLSDLSIDGVDRCTDGLILNQNADFTIERVFVENCDTGIDLDAALIAELRAVTVQKCDLALLIGGATAPAALQSGANLVQFNSCKLIANSVAIDTEPGTGPDSNYGFQVLFADCEIESNGLDADLTPGTYAHTCRFTHAFGSALPGVVFRGCWFEGNHADTSIYFINEEDLACSLVVDDCLFVGTVLHDIWFINNGANANVLSVSDCGMTSTPSAMGGVSIKQEGANVSGQVTGSVYDSIEFDSVYFAVKDALGRYRTDIRFVLGGGLRFLATGGSTGCRVFSEGSENLTVQATGGHLHVQTSATGYLWHEQNLFRLGSNYTWFDALGDLRVHTSQPSNKNTDGLIVKGFRAPDTLLDIVDTGNDVATFDFLRGNGNYLVTIVIVATDESGTSYKSKYQLDVARVAGVITGADLATPIEIGTPAPELGVTFANSAGNLAVTVANNTGGGEKINVTVLPDWSFFAQPAAPTP